MRNSIWYEIFLMVFCRKAKNIFYNRTTAKKAEIRESPCFFCAKNQTHHLTMLHRTDVAGRDCGHGRREMYHAA